MNIFKKNKGITLIALIITIIILVILAAIAINQLTQNGLLEKSHNAEGKTKYSVALESMATELMATKAEIYGQNKACSIEEIAKHMDNAANFSIKKWYNRSNQLQNWEGTINYEDIDSLVVVNKQYPMYNFLIDENGELSGIKIGEISDSISKNDFNPISNKSKSSDPTSVIPKYEDATGTAVAYTALNKGDYVNYPVIYENLYGHGNGLYKPLDKYNRWRILDIDTTNQVVKLVSAGIPLQYSCGSNATNVETNLTTNFFTTQISSGTVDCYQNCGFKKGSDGSFITNMNDLKNEFTNGLTQTINNHPYVTALSKEDVERYWGSSLVCSNTPSERTSFASDDMLAIPCKEPESSKYATTWFPGVYNHPNSSLSNKYTYFVNARGEVDYNNGLVYRNTSSYKIKFRSNF